MPFRWWSLWMAGRPRTSTGTGPGRLRFMVDGGRLHLANGAGSQALRPGSLTPSTTSARRIQLSRVPHSAALAEWPSPIERYAHA